MRGIVKMSTAGWEDSSLFDCSPLSQACIKALVDRAEDKRKIAASEIEKMTAEFSMSNNLAMINRLVIVLGRKFCLSHAPNIRKGGLLGLSAVIVGFKNGFMIDPPPEMIEEIVRPILTCFLDSDPRVRSLACESLYNVTKVAKANILPLFESIFDNLAKIVADPDITVRSNAEMLDRLLKDIIAEQQTHDMRSFAPNIKEYIYAQNPFTRMFIISWVRFLNSRLDIVEHLSHLLDGIFNCLCDSTEEIRASTLNLLSEFLHQIVNCPSDKISISSLMGTILKHAKNDQEDLVQYTAIVWLRQLITLMNNQDLMTFSPGILQTILPCLAVSSSPEGSQASNYDRLSPNPTVQRFLAQPSSRGNICEVASFVHSLLMEQLTTVLKERRTALHKDPAETLADLEPILEVLVKELRTHEHPVIKLAILDQLKQLKRAYPELTYSNSLLHQLFQVLLETLSAKSDAVVKNALRVIADIFNFDGSSEEKQVVLGANVDDEVVISNDEEALPGTPASERRTKSPSKIGPPRTPSSTSKKVAMASNNSDTTSGSNQQQASANINRFVQALCHNFREKEIVFEERASFIILNLCSMVRAEVIYKSFAELLKDEKNDLQFAFNMVQKLNQILLTTQPMYRLRSRLSNEDDPEMTTLFSTLYYAWCHSPIAALTLCFLTNNYRLASEIVTVLAQADINLDILTQIDWVVQLIESPVFSALRMRLLDASSNLYLLQSLYGLLMILPQSEAFKRLSNRLDQAHKFMSIVPPSSRTTSATSKPTATLVKSATDASKSSKGGPSTNHDVLIRHFHVIQNLHLLSPGRPTDNEDRA